MPSRRALAGLVAVSATFTALVAVGVLGVAWLVVGPLIASWSYFAVRFAGGRTTTAPAARDERDSGGGSSGPIPQSPSSGGAAAADVVEPQAAEPVTTEGLDLLADPTLKRPIEDLSEAEREDWAREIAAATTDRLRLEVDAIRRDLEEARRAITREAGSRRRAEQHANRLVLLATNVIGAAHAVRTAEVVPPSGHVLMSGERGTGKTALFAARLGEALQAEEPDPWLYATHASLLLDPGYPTEHSLWQPTRSERELAGPQLLHRVETRELLASEILLSDAVRWLPTYDVVDLLTLQPHWSMLDATAVLAAAQIERRSLAELTYFDRLILAGGTLKLEQARQVALLPSPDMSSGGSQASSR